MISSGVNIIENNFNGRYNTIVTIGYPSILYYYKIPKFHVGSPIPFSFLDIIYIHLESWNTFK